MPIIDPRLRTAIRGHLVTGPATRLFAFTVDALDINDCNAVAHIAVAGMLPWPAAGPSVTVAADPLRLPFAAALFDTVVVTGTLEFSDTPSALLREVRRVIAPAGIAILAVPRRRLEFGNRLNGRHFSRAQLDRLLVEAALEPTDWATVGGSHVVRAQPRGDATRAPGGRRASVFRPAPA